MVVFVDLGTLPLHLGNGARESDHATSRETAVDALVVDRSADIVDGVDDRPGHPDPGITSTGGDCPLETARELTDAPSTVASGCSEPDHLPFDDEHPQRRVCSEQRHCCPQPRVAGADDRHVDIDVARKCRPAGEWGVELVEPERLRAQGLLVHPPSVPSASGTKPRPIDRSSTLRFMRVLVVGAGGVGSAFVAIASRREAYTHITVGDIDVAKAQAAVGTASGNDGGTRIVAAHIDASSEESVADLARSMQADVVLNACDPRFNPPIFEGAFAAGCNYVDMAMNLSVPHATKPYEKTGIRLGDGQFAESPTWKARGMMALCGMGVEPGFSDVAARYAADELFSEIHEIGVRDGADLVVDGYDFAPTFSIWTTIEECLNPPVIYERERGWFTTAPFSEPETSPSRRASVRSSASTSNTRRSSSCPGGSTRSA